MRQPSLTRKRPGHIVPSLTYVFRDGRQPVRKPTTPRRQPRVFLCWRCGDSRSQLGGIKIQRWKNETKVESYIIDLIQLAGELLADDDWRRNLDRVTAVASEDCCDGKLTRLMSQRVAACLHGLKRHPPVVSANGDAKLIVWRLSVEAGRGSASGSLRLQMDVRERGAMPGPLPIVPRRSLRLVEPGDNHFLRAHEMVMQEEAPQNAGLRNAPLDQRIIRIARVDGS